MTNQQTETSILKTDLFPQLFSRFTNSLFKINQFFKTAAFPYSFQAFFSGWKWGTLFNRLNKVWQQQSFCSHIQKGRKVRFPFSYCVFENSFLVTEQRPLPPHKKLMQEAFRYEMDILTIYAMRSQQPSFINPPAGSRHEHRNTPPDSQKHFVCSFVASFLGRPYRSCRAYLQKPSILVSMPQNHGLCLHRRRGHRRVSHDRP